MRIVPLGINGFVPTFGRHTTSFLVLTTGEAILLDAGTGVARLFESGIAQLLSPHRQLHIILSHYHLDHIIGLSYLAGIQRDISISIYAPAPPMVEAHPNDSLRTLLQPPFFPMSLEQFPMRVSITPVAEDRFTIGRLTVLVRRQKHPGGSIGIRIGDLVFMTDTIVDDMAVPFVHGAKLLLHEVWLSDEEIQDNSQDLLAHSFAGGVIDIALKGGVDRLMPIHFHPRRSGNELELLAEGMKRKGVQVLLPSEGKIYELPHSF